MPGCSPSPRGPYSALCLFLSKYFNVIFISRNRKIFMQSKAKVCGFCYCIFASVNFNREVKQENTFQRKAHMTSLMFYLQTIQHFNVLVLCPANSSCTGLFASATTCQHLHRHLQSVIVDNDILVNVCHLIVIFLVCLNVVFSTAGALVVVTV